MLIERYNEVKKHVEEACKRVGRDPREVTVIAVSKTKPLEMVEELRKEKVILERIRYRRSEISTQISVGR
jgi:uncharacterized pyridoxal phosphate-containing UPF0001 family protein